MCQIFGGSRLNFGGSRFVNFVPNSTIELYSFDKEEQCCLKYRNLSLYVYQMFRKLGGSQINKKIYCNS